MSERTDDAVRAAVRSAYATVVTPADEAGCRGTKPAIPCCGADAAVDQARRIGYSEEEVAAAPEESNFGLGCGNPTAIAALRPGETVVDLGSGAGFDCFLAARAVGPTGRVIGVDMTPEMIAKARENARKVALDSVQFRLGEIEHLPVADATADVVISNCVLNLSPDKPQVLRETYRVLVPGGRLAVSDVVQIAPMPESMANDIDLHCACGSGAAPVADLQRWLADAGFRDIRIEIDEASRAAIKEWAPGSGLENHVVSARIEAVKPVA